MKKVKKLIILLALLTMVATLGGLAIACSGGFEKNKEYILKEITFKGDNWTQEEKDGTPKNGSSKIKFDDTKFYTSQKQDDGSWGNWYEGGTYTKDGDQLKGDIIDGEIVAKITIKGNQLITESAEYEGLSFTMIFKY